MVPTNRKYTQNDEWLLEENGQIKIGITDYAQHELGDIVFVDLPGIGDEFSAGDDFAVVESVKAAAEIYTQVTGKVVAVNEALSDQPDLLNQDAYNNYIAIFEGTIDGEVMSAEEYEAKIAK
ncbi:MAG: glycine cleavage system protein GcvH [Clostridia bacterium]|nr:glycine cleavage system protein GcvH [Candidatus Pelethousia sp.]NCB30067.1 glycine cleavage system protein GcvH [Clostridia bacterium]